MVEFNFKSGIPTHCVTYHPYKIKEFTDKIQPVVTTGARYF